MALVVKDRVRETTSTTGTGTVTLAGAVSGFQAFSVIGNGNDTYYCIYDSGTGDWEVGIGTYTLSGTTLSRNTVLSSSNSGNLVNFAANAKDVFCTYPSEVALYVSGSTIVPGTSAQLGVTYGGTGLSSTPTNGQLPIGNGTGYTLGTLTQGTGITVSNGSGTITVTNAGVTSLTAGTGISVSGSTGGVTVTNSLPMTYPGAGIANSTGSAWGTSYSTTGSGTVVALATSPSFTTPTLGVASATSINKVAFTAPATGSTLTILDGKTLTANNSITLSGTDATTMTFPSTSTTVAGLGITQTFTGVNTFQNASGIRVEAASTQDAVVIDGRSGGTSSFAVTVIPTTLTASRTLTLPDATTTVVGTDATQTLTNKRVTPRVTTTTSSATPTINTDNVDMYGLTAQAVDITSFSTNLSGTPTDGQKLWIYIVGTAARAITWGASFEASTVPLPTTTVTTNRLDVGFVWNAATSKWRCVASA